MAWPPKSQVLFLPEADDTFSHVQLKPEAEGLSFLFKLLPEANDTVSQNLLTAEADSVASQACSWLMTQASLPQIHYLTLVSLSQPHRLTPVSLSQPCHLPHASLSQPCQQTSASLSETHLMLPAKMPHFCFLAVLEILASGDFVFYVDILPGGRTAGGVFGGWSVKDFPHRVCFSVAIFYLFCHVCFVLFISNFFSFIVIGCITHCHWLHTLTIFKPQCVFVLGEILFSIYQPLPNLCSVFWFPFFFILFCFLICFQFVLPRLCCSLE